MLNPRTSGQSPSETKLANLKYSTHLFFFFFFYNHQHACQSDGSSMYFHGEEGVGHSYASTRDIDLHREDGHRYWEEDFENPPNG